MSEEHGDLVDNAADIRVQVRQRYGAIAGQSAAAAESCCGTGDSDAGGACCGPAATIELEQIPAIYESADVAELPREVTDLSLGCGDPIALAQLKPGQVVLDLGSGGGIDCFLAAKRVGETGRVIGVDMTAEMIEKARANKAKLGATNVEFRLGEIEHLPVADESVDVIVSNCVINLSPDKPQVFREAFRVLRPGGRMAVSDMVTGGALPNEVKNSLSAWVGCIAGALQIEEYLAAIESAGFVEASYTPVYLDKALVDEAAEQLGIADITKENPDAYRAIFSAKVTARKPLSP